MKLEAAYKALVKTRNPKAFGSQQTLWNARAQVRRKELPSVELMRERLVRAGYRMVQEESWEKVL